MHGNDVGQRNGCVCPVRPPHFCREIGFAHHRDLGFAHVLTRPARQFPGAFEVSVHGRFPGLGLESPWIDGLLNAGSSKMPIDLGGDLFAKRSHCPRALPLSGVELRSCALTEATWSNLTRGHQKVDMVVAPISVATRLMDCDQNGDLVAIDQQLPKAQRQGLALLVGQALRERNLHLPSNKRVLACFGRLVCVPELLGI
jgi:hypothetical protein